VPFCQSFQAPQPGCPAGDPRSTPEPLITICAVAHVLDVDLGIEFCLRFSRNVFFLQRGPGIGLAYALAFIFLRVGPVSPESNPPSNCVEVTAVAKSDHASPVIMVVDDSADNREVLKVIFERGGYKVVEAADGRKAVELAERECPDLIFMDLSMPILDGYGAVPLIREVREMRSVPIIACTAHDTSDHRTRAFAVGFNEYLTKPVDFILLASLVNRFLIAA